MRILVPVIAGVGAGIVVALFAIAAAIRAVARDFHPDEESGDQVEREKAHL